MKELDKNEFSATFSDQVSLNTFSKLTTVGLALYGYKIKISKTNIDPAASSILHPAWIRVGGVPSFAKKEEVIKETVSLMAEPIKVDEFSLLRDEPLRVRVNCRDPARLRGFVEIFFKGVGYEMKFWTEGAPNTLRNTNAPSDSENQNDKKDRTDKSNQGTQNHRNVDKDEPKRNFDREFDACQGESQEDSMEDLIRDGTPTDTEVPEEGPIPTFHPESNQRLSG